MVKIIIVCKGYETCYMDGFKDVFLPSETSNHQIMKRILYLLAALVAVIGFTGCPGHEPEVINLGTIPEKYLPTVPYEDGQTFYLQHESDRVVIPFKVMRYRTTNEGNNEFGFDDYGAKFQPAPSVYFNYEVDVTTCKPDYPLFDIDIRFSNAYMADSVYYNEPVRYKYAQLSCHHLYASIPFIGEPTEQFKVLDTFEVNGHVYHDVFEFANEGQDLQGIYIKTLYYNYEKGVIAIDMSNSEKYLLYEEE